MEMARLFPVQLSMTPFTLLRRRVSSSMPSTPIGLPALNSSAVQQGAPLIVILCKVEQGQEGHAGTCMSARTQLGSAEMTSCHAGHACTWRNIEGLLRLWACLAQAVAGAAVSASWSLGWR